MGSETIGEIMISQEEILRRAKEIGRQISRDYKGEEVLIVGILKGAVLWMADLVKCIEIPAYLDFMVVSSYGASTKTSGVVKIVKDLDEDIEGRNVIIVEDIVDSGVTLNYLKGYLEARNAKSIKISTLLDKPSGRKTDLKADYVGFEVGDKFIVGYGLDFDQRYRNLPYITCLDSNV